MKVGVKVTPKSEVLDTQGRTVQETLQSHSFQLKSCRVGRYIEIDIDEADPQESLKKVAEMAKFVLYNPLIEEFAVELVQS